MPGLVPIRKRANQRRHRITIRSSITTVDSIGGLPEGNYVQFGQDWAALDEIPFVQNSTEHGMLYKWTIKYRRDVLEEFENSNKRVQVLDTVRAYNVLEVENPEGRNIELIMHCAPA